MVKNSIIMKLVTFQLDARNSLSRRIPTRFLTFIDFETPNGICMSLVWGSSYILGEVLKNFYDDLMKDYSLFSQQSGKGISTNTKTHIHLHLPILSLWRVICWLLSIMEREWQTVILTLKKNIYMLRGLMIFQESNWNEKKGLFKNKYFRRNPFIFNA